MGGERAVVTAEDHAAALAVVNTWTESRPPLQCRTSDLLELVGMIAATRADARHGDESGDRQLVSVHTHTSMREWRAAPGDAQVRATLHARRHLTTELVQQGLRPLEAWPALQQRLLCYCTPGPSSWAALAREDQDHPGFRVVQDGGHADLMCLYLETLAVAE